MKSFIRDLIVMDLSSLISEVSKSTFSLKKELLSSPFLANLPNSLNFLLTTPIKYILFSYSKLLKYSICIFLP